MYEKAKINGANISIFAEQFDGAMQLMKNQKGTYFVYTIGKNSRQKRQNVLDIIQDVEDKAKEYLSEPRRSEP